MINRLISLMLSILYIQIFGWNLNINNFYFDNMVSQIYPAELQLNKTNTSDTEVSFLDSSILLISFLLKFTINVTILILSIFHFRW